MVKTARPCFSRTWRISKWGWDVADGLDMLRSRRGEQMVSFSDVADHLFDYCDLHPDAAATLHNFAAFLTAVEHLPHDHDADPQRGLPRLAALSSTR